jgi:orotidine-5'-phosphate decarboxylase
MTKQELVNQIIQKQSFLCVGLDTDVDKIPKFLLDYENPILAFNQEIIAATHDLCVAYKPNTAFYEAQGIDGWQNLFHTFQMIPSNTLKIADAKRGDIGNTSSMYANAFFNKMNADAITVSPYMGQDSVTPFVAFQNKWTIVLAATSNSGSADFQLQQMQNENALFENVISTSSQWGTDENMMYVVGATRVEAMQRIRKICPNHFLLVPGVGAQGGSLNDVFENLHNNSIGLLVNSSRQILYASSGKDFAYIAREKAQEIKVEMNALLEKYNFF